MVSHSILVSESVVIDLRCDYSRELHVFILKVISSKCIDFRAEPSVGRGDPGLEIERFLDSELAVSAERFVSACSALFFFERLILDSV